MGQAKRRKELGLMPEPSVKPRKTARVRSEYMDSYMGMSEVMGVISALMMQGRLRETFAMRSEMARMTRELD